MGHLKIVGISFLIYAFLNYAHFLQECNWGVKQGLGICKQT
jgi:hypothetical protein